MITLEATYAKKIGLPGYSSHQFSITLKTEIADVIQIQQESTRLYNLLQSGVDTSIRQIGFLPNQNGGHNRPPVNGHNNSHGNGNGQGNRTGNGHSPDQVRRPDRWACSPKQQDLILDIVDENRLDKEEIERLAQDRFSKGVRHLNKLEASGLIDELLARHGKPTARRGQAVAATGGRR